MKRLTGRVYLMTSLLASLILFLSSCSKGGEVKIGVIVPWEGSNLANYGTQMEAGIQLALSEIQAAMDEGKLDYRYTVIFENESEDIEKVKESFENLRSKGVTAIIGAASSAATLALAPLANEHKIVLISPGSSSPEINSGQTDYVFRNHPSDTLEAQKLSNVIFQKSKIQRCLMVRAKNAYSEGITFELLRFARQNSQQLPDRVVKFAANPDEVNWAEVVDQIVEINPEGVFLGAYNNELIPLLREIKSREELAKTYLFTSSSFSPTEAIKELGPEGVEGLIFTGYQWDARSTKPAVQEFTSKFESQFPQPPTMYAATGYEALWIAVEAIESVQNFRIRDDVRSAVNNNVFGSTQEGKEGHFVGLLGETDFNKRGDVTRIPLVYRMTNGRKVELTNEDMEIIKRDILTRI